MMHNKRCLFLQSTRSLIKYNFERATGDHMMNVIIL